MVVQPRRSTHCFRFKTNTLPIRFFVIPLLLLLWTLASPLLAQSDCDVELDAELGVGPNGAHLFEAFTYAIYASFQWNVNGSTLAEGSDNTLEWCDILGAPFWDAVRKNPTVCRPWRGQRSPPCPTPLKTKCSSQVGQKEPSRWCSEMPLAKP